MSHHEAIDETACKLVGISYLLDGADGGTRVPYRVSSDWASHGLLHDALESRLERTGCTLVYTVDSRGRACSVHLRVNDPSGPHIHRVEAISDSIPKAFAMAVCSLAMSFGREVL